MKTWTTIDKTQWPSRGEWDSEPDKAQWIAEATRFDCLIVRGRSGALCGYVGVPKIHPMFEKDYDDVHDITDIDVHGGLTFSGRCRPGEDESKGICHTGDVANKTVWWLGFDCAHCDDVLPAYDIKYFGECYKNMAYVKRQVTYLAKQVAQ